MQGELIPVSEPVTAPIAKPAIDDVDAVASLWNEIAGAAGLSKVRTLTAKRRTAIRAMLKEFSPSEWVEICRNCAASSFLTGGNDRGWKANIDFALRIDKAAAILEGNYAGGPQRPTRGQTGALPQVGTEHQVAAQLAKIDGISPDLARAFEIGSRTLKNVPSADIIVEQAKEVAAAMAEQSAGRGPLTAEASAYVQTAKLKQLMSGSASVGAVNIPYQQQGHWPLLGVTLDVIKPHKVDGKDQDWPAMQAHKRKVADSIGWDGTTLDPRWLEHPDLLAAVQVWDRDRIRRTQIDDYRAVLHHELTDYLAEHHAGETILGSDLITTIEAYQRNARTHPGGDRRA